MPVLVKEPWGTEWSRQTASFIGNVIKSLERKVTGKLWIWFSFFKRLIRELTGEPYFFSEGKKNKITLGWTWQANRKAVASSLPKTGVAGQVSLFRVWLMRRWWVRVATAATAPSPRDWSLEQGVSVSAPREFHRDEGRRPKVKCGRRWFYLESN